MDIMEVSRSQPGLLVSFDHPAVASYLAGDMASLVVVQDNQVLGRLVVVTVCTLDWSVSEVYNCPHSVLPTWVCSLPSHWVSPAQLPHSTAAQLYVMSLTAGKAAFITDIENSCHKQLVCHTRGQFFTQFLTQAAPHLNISSFTTLASLCYTRRTWGRCPAVSSSLLSWTWWWGRTSWPSSPRKGRCGR